MRAQGAHKGVLETMEIFCTLIMLQVIQICTFVKMYGSIKEVNFTV